jgi:hypothetical protein
MSKIQPRLLWKLARPYMIVGKILVLLVGSLTYLQIFEFLRKLSRAELSKERLDQRSHQGYIKG